MEARELFLGIQGLNVYYFFLIVIEKIPKINWVLEIETLEQGIVERFCQIEYYAVQSFPSK